jgi:PIN domain nuclease of toxin-antitoxin system
MILLDTHALVWLLSDDLKLSPRARTTIREQVLLKNPIAISDVTLYEMAWLVEKKRIEIKVPLELYLEEVQSRFVAKRVTAAIAAKAASLPREYPSDPMDRIIAATAFVEGLDLLTADGLIRRSGAVNTIW